MREITNPIPYLSPSSFHLATEDREAFYIEYLSGMPRVGRPTTLAMCLGSAFDARVKEKLAAEFLPESERGKFKFNPEKISSPDIDTTVKDSLLLFEKYVSTGAFADLVLELNQGLKGSLNFQFKLTTEIKELDLPMGNINTDSAIPPLKISGWPDLMFMINRVDTDNTNNPSSVIKVIYDWKVNGYYSKYPTSPIMYYSKCRSGSKLPEPHKGFKPIKVWTNNGDPVIPTYLLPHNGPCPDVKWRDQLTMYSWMSGAGLEETNLHGIEQVTGNGDKLRFTSARFYDDDVEYKRDLLKRLRQLWTDIHDGHFFKNLSLEDSQRKCELLDKRARLIDKDEYTPLTSEELIGKIYK